MVYMYISRRHLIVLGILIVVLLAGGVFFRDTFMPVPRGADIVSFKDCIDAGFPVLESYPRQCRTPDGRTFTEKIEKETDKNNLIRVTRPRLNEEIISPLSIEGEARGTWFFEASFPIELTDKDGRIIAEGHAEALSNWMTEDFVPFRAVLEFSASGGKTPMYGERGTLILRKDNPSGISEHDDSLEIPIRFAVKEIPPIETGRERGGCMSTGCSGQVCADADIITTCEYKPEYACYENAVCERQADGQCGWTLTAAVGRCLLELSSDVPQGEMLRE